MANPVEIVEEKTLADYIRRIDPLLECACRTGIAIAREFADAEASLNGKDFKALRDHYHFSYSTARKLVKVGGSDRIKQYEDKLACIDAWSTLHELAKLEQHQFEHFAAQYLLGDEPRNFMRADVERFKSGTCAKREPFSLLAAIEVDLSRLQEPEDIDAIAEEVEQFGRKLGARFPATRVRPTDLVARLDAKIEAEATKAVKDEVTCAVKAARKRLKEVVHEEIARMSGPNKRAKFLKHWGLEWDEIFRSDINPNDRLDYFGHERVEPHIVDSEFDNHWAHAESGTCATSPEEDAELAELLAEFKEEIARESTDSSVKGDKPK